MPNCLKKKKVVNFTFLPPMPISLISHQHWMSCLFNLDNMISHCYFNLNFLNYYWSCVFWLCGFAVLWTIYSYLLSVFCLYWIIFLLLICKFSYTLNINHLSVIWGTNVLSQPTVCLLILFTGSHTKVSNYYVIRLIFSL